MLTILLDENIVGYAEYLSRHVFSTEWNFLSSGIGVRILTLDEVGLPKGSTDEQIWKFCQGQHLYLLTDNRNQDKPGSLEEIIRIGTSRDSLPVFTISDLQRFRSDRQYVELLVAKLLEYLMDSDKIQGAGRLYLP